MDDSAPWLSIVIPAFNEERGLGDCLRRVRDACDRCDAVAGRYEIIVCDNRSTDGTAEVARAWGCRVVFEEVNQIGRARNRGASVAAGAWLLFIDADSWPSVGLMNDAAGVMGGAEFVGCGSTIRVVDGPWWFKWAWESKNLSMRLLNWCPGGFLLCRAEAFRELGGFSLAHFVFEEADFVKRLKQLGAKRGQRFTVLHRHPISTSGRKGTQYGFWSWLGTAARMMVAPRRAVRDRAFAEKWYATRR